jgi:hypothetical protein
VSRTNVGSILTAHSPEQAAAIAKFRFQKGAQYRTAWLAARVRADFINLMIQHVWDGTDIGDRAENVLDTYAYNGGTFEQMRDLFGSGYDFAKYDRKAHAILTAFQARMARL